ncbi:NtaA/DmoA family FMN-dependent monooxygenase [Sphingobium sp. YR768]|uniref:NtaA/DmoA family FMN-dependent monooxygenase n=1 Tax=Sphingobium sp. YR768 TaxID=1884365 RepID=UPI0008B6A28C|nr:NtaA/DmoA family FMN-dependent monooxygenase [Sphingobium sp. YR768]SER25624.1 FMN-dependent oxidoreductase, nitrilotriacetate monooxygenase family [Sphingobium sp. YR768]
MTTAPSLCVGLSIAVTWLTGNGWRRPGSRVEDIYSSDFYIDIARQAEAAGVDFLFRPDSLFLDPAALATSPGFSSLDPTLLLSTLARETQRIGLVTTASTSFYPPYIVARQLQSLNWLSNGRAGWNIVTSIDGSGNFGSEPFPSSTRRYAQAAEFTDVVRALWSSYPAEALAYDRDNGLYGHTEQVRPIEHRGTHFAVEGPLNLPTFPGRRIPLFQAGASNEGRDFAARVADGVFAATPDMGAAIELRQDIRKRAASHGRDPDTVRVLPGLSLYLADSEAEARDLFAETHRGLGEARKHRLIADSLGLDVSSMPEDQRITPAMLPDQVRTVRSRTHTALLHRLIARDTPTVGDLLSRPEVAGSAHWLFVGRPDDAVREIERWAHAGAIDGFIALPGGSDRSVALLLDELLTNLQLSGLFRSSLSE